MSILTYSLIISSLKRSFPPGIITTAGSPSKKNDKDVA